MLFFFGSVNTSRNTIATAAAAAAAAADNTTIRSCIRCVWSVNSPPSSSLSLVSYTRHTVLISVLFAVLITSLGPLIMTFKLTLIDRCRDRRRLTINDWLVSSSDSILCSH